MNQTHLETEPSTRSATITSEIFNRAIVSLIHQDNQLVECNLTCQIPLAIYQTIVEQGLFNLKPELCSQPISFAADTDITLKATLHPDRFPDLAEHATSPEVALQYLQHLSQTQPDHPLLNLDSWFALSAHQGEQAYTTLWATLNPSKLAAGQIPNDELTDSLSQFFANLVEPEFTKATEHLGQNLVNGFTDLFRLESDRSLTNTMIDFFTNDDWTFTKVQGKPILEMGYQGESGRWVCYARANDNPQQFTFYSIYPAVVPEKRKLAIVEFLTRANFGIVIGNFEFNFSNGEVLYKTSIDVEGDRLTPALIKRLVYTNVAIVDQYLPGIAAVLEEKLSPEAAIAQIEEQYQEESYQKSVS